jgi:catechol 2,3-dioxygenase-like lactoylglutathione lyase family enzyme
VNLADERLTAFLSTAQPKVARRFYEGVLGLAFVLESEQMMVFDAGPARVTLAKGDIVTPRVGTTLGWNVKDLRGAVRALAAKGVVFERFDGMEQDEMGVWSPTPGQGVAWFKDPDGNLLSVSG